MKATGTPAVARALVVLWCVLAAIAPARGQNYTWQALGPQDAIEAVRAFEGDPNLEVSTPVLVPADPSGSPDLYAETAMFTMTAGRYRYMVSKYAATRLVRTDSLWASDKLAFYGQPYTQALAAQVMPQGAAIAVAQAFVSERFPDAQIMSQAGVNAIPAESDRPPTWTINFTGTYSVWFRQQCGGGVTGPSLCIVDVDSVRGQVVGYSQKYYPVLAPTVPVLTGEQAMAAAMSVMLAGPGDPGSVEQLCVTPPDALGVERLNYIVTFSGYPITNPESGATFRAAVDALSGEVISAGTLMGLPPRTGRLSRRPCAADVAAARRRSRARPIDLGAVLAGRPTVLSYRPLLVGRTPLLCARYLTSGVEQARLSYHRGRVTLAGSRMRVAFRVGSRRWMCDGRLLRLSTAPVVLGGRCYVPLDVAAAALRFRITFDAGHGAVRFDTLDRAGR